MEKLRNIFGHVGSWSGFICFTHCISIPMLIAICPAIGMTFLCKRWMELSILSAGVIFSGLSMGWGYLSHRKARAFFALIGAIGWFYLAFNSHYHVRYVLYGGVYLAIGNYVNQKMCRSCPCCEYELDHAN